MTALQIAPAVVSLLLLGAHFLRSRDYPAVIVVALLIVLVFVRRPWAARTLQASLVLGALEWVRSAAVLVHARTEMGAPFLRLAVILGGVALFTLASALLLQARRAKAHFRIAARTASD
jgi:hypothetical protein